MIKLSNISKRWTRFCLSNINLEVQEGEYFFILGPTGAGKTLLLETIAGFHKPDNGKIYFDEVDVTSVPPEKRGVGFVYQHSMLFPSMSVEDNITFGFRYSKIPKEERQERLDSLIQFLGISHLLPRRNPLSLSGGEQRKVALARALVIRPKIILLDEPLTPLDLATREELRGELKRIPNEFGATILHVTHDRETARAIGDKLAVLRNGKIIQTGTVEDAFTRPNCEFTAKFLGVKNIFYGESTLIDNRRALIRISGTSGERVDMADAISVDSNQMTPHKTTIKIIATSQLEGKVGITINPTTLTLSKIHPKVPNAAPGRSSTFPAIVKAIVEIGSVCEIKADICGQDIFADIPKEEIISHDLHIGSHIYLNCKPESINVFARSDTS